MKFPHLLLVLALMTAAELLACSRADSGHDGAGASAAIRPTQGNSASGTVEFTAVPGGVRVRADLEGLAPGTHGFHVHEKGDCSAPDASSAGEHFNPTGTKHGAREHQSAHTGDMGNVEADKSGKAHVEYVDPKLSLEGPASVIGKAVVVHEKADDLATQPSGNSGARIACGVVAAGDVSADAKHE